MREILIITTCFPPENAIGSIRLSKMVKVLVNDGHRVTVISPELHEGSQIDNSLIIPEIERITHFTVPQSNLFNKLLLKKRNDMLTKKSATEHISRDANMSMLKQIKAILMGQVHFLYLIMRNLDWRNQVVSFVEKQLSTRKFDVVIASYPSLGAPWAALKVKRLGLTENFLCDFRDPVVYEKNFRNWNSLVKARIQASLISNSDTITTVSAGVADMISGNNELRNLTVLPNGFDAHQNEPHTTDLYSKDSLVFCYVGSLYGGKRDFTPFFKAIAELKNHVDTDLVKVIYAGKEGGVLKAQAEQFGLSELIIDRGYITRRESLALQRQSDICLVSTWNSDVDKGVMTGKVFEYFGNNKPVLAIVNGTKCGSEMAEVIDKVQAGCCYEEASTNPGSWQNLLSYINECYKQKRNEGKVTATYNEYVNDYSYERFAQRFGSLT